MSMKVSIVIPIYNVSVYIENCLESVRRQIYQDLEVILVDDCGTDNSMEIVQEYLEYHNFVEVKIIHHTHNRGLSAARNTGLEAATGDYVFSYWSPPWKHSLMILSSATMKLKEVTRNIRP